MAQDKSKTGAAAPPAAESPAPADEKGADPAAGTNAGNRGDKSGAGEVGGPKGPEPTRYGDWEVGGRCTDF